MDFSTNQKIGFNSERQVQVASLSNAGFWALASVAHFLIVQQQVNAKVVSLQLSAHYHQEFLTFFLEQSSHGMKNKTATTTLNRGR